MGVRVSSEVSKVVLLLWMSMGVLSSVFAQTDIVESISGTVQTSDGETLPGVNIYMGETLKGTITDIEGAFSLPSVSPGKYDLTVSCVGFQTQNIPIQKLPDQSYYLEIILQEDVHSMSDLVVTGKSATRRVIEQAYQVSSISATEMKNATTDVQQVLSRIPGVRIQQEGGLGSNTTFSLNGFSGDQVKFFIDGIPMDNFGSSLSLGDLPVNLINRVEVYKGVVPVWLGTDALGGVVNIISNTSPKYLDASYSFGSFNTHRASVNGAYTWENGFTVNGNLFYNYSDNDYKVLAAIGNGDNEEKWYRRFHDRYHSATGKIEVGVVNKPYADQLRLGAILTGNHKQQQTGSTMAKVFGGVFSESQSAIGTIKYNKRDLLLDGLDVSLYAAYTHNESHNVDSLRGITYDWSGTATHIPGSNNGETGERTFTIFDVDEWTGRLNTSYVLNTKSSLALNYATSNYHREVSDSLNPDNEHYFFPKKLLKNTVGLAYKFDPVRQWSTTVFAKFYYLNAQSSKLYDQFKPTERVEELTNQQQKVGYGMATAYFLRPELQLKLSYEHAFRMPTPTEYFGDGMFVNPNPDLQPEVSDNLNFSINYHKIFGNHKLTGGVSFLYRNAQNLIYASVSPGSPMSKYINSLKIRFLGTEGNVQYNFKNRFQVGGNITYQDITDRAQEVLIHSASGHYWQTNFTYGFRLPNRPYLFGNLNSRLSFQDVLLEESTLNLEYFLNYSEKYYLVFTELGTNNDDYIIPQQLSHDVQLTYTLQNGKYNISALCSNLFDAKLYDKYRLQKPGRAFYIKVRFSL